MWVTLGGKQPQRQSQAQSPHLLEIHPDVIRRGILCSTKKEWGTFQESLHFWGVLGSSQKALGAGCICCWVLGPKAIHRSSPGKSDTTLETRAPICEFWDKDYEDTFSEKSAVLSLVCPQGHTDARVDWHLSTLWSTQRLRPADNGMGVERHEQEGSSVLFCCCFHRWTEEASKGGGGGSL